MRFSYRMVPVVYQLFWAAMAAGKLITDAAIRAGTVSQAGHPVVGGGGWGSAAPSPWLERPLFEVRCVHGVRADTRLLAGRLAAPLGRCV
jgi:hypothetical protein